MVECIYTKFGDSTPNSSWLVHDLLL